ncbi:MAG: metallophosphoesterase, partial [Hyphomicrobium sp.]|nr:metallophosphoesterase [Hyphomicrobium sp.]
MKFTFLHTADWQIGKRFGSFPGDTAAVLRDQRLQAVDRLAQVAIGSGCAAVLVAGDVFDAETVPGTLSGQLLARLKAYPALTWHLLPGNHDPGRAGGVWSSLVGGLPANVQVHLEAKPAELAGGVILLPAPLMSKRTSGDPTAWMDGAPSPAGALRIGLAHGSVQGFGSAGDANVPIDPARVKSAALSYLALGDWHGTTRISDRAWYSGTPEPDGFRDNDPGNALIVRLDGAAPPAVEPVATAHFSWSSREVKVDGAEALVPVEADVARLGVAAARTLLSLQLAGTVAMTELGRIEERLGQLGPQLFHLAFDMSGITAYADVADLEALASPALSEIAQRLKAKSDQGGAEAVI